jgi:UrcA family protein
MSRLIVSASALALFAVPSAALAAPDIQTVNFSYDPSEVSTAEKASNLHQRIAALAKAECSYISSPPIRNPRAEQCAKEIADQLVARINSPLLTSISRGSFALASGKP